MSRLLQYRHSVFSKKSLRTFLLFLLFLYFSLHLLQGERGYIKLIELQQHKTERQIEYDAIKAKRQLIEHSVKLLRNESLNKDMLDEQARSKLGYVEKDDIVIITK